MEQNVNADVSHARLMTKVNNAPVQITDKVERRCKSAHYNVKHC